MDYNPHQLLGQVQHFIGYAIAFIRIEKGFNQTELGNMLRDKCNVRWANTETVRQIENGQVWVTMDCLHVISFVLGCPISVFLESALDFKCYVLKPKRRAGRPQATRRKNNNTNR